MLRFRLLPIAIVMVMASSLFLTGCEDTANLRKGMHLQGTKSYKSAIEHFKRFLEQFPETKRKAQVEEKIADSYLHWAENEKQLKHWESGVELMQIIIDDYPETTSAAKVEDVLPEFLLEWGSQLSHSGEFLDSLKVLKRLIRSFPASGYAQQGRDLRQKTGIIAFNSGTDIYVMNADGSKLRKVAESAISPTISPDGNKLAYIKIRKHTDTVGYLCTCDIDGRKVRQLLDNPVASEPSFSPDGTNILITKGDAFQQVDLSGKTIYVHFGIKDFDTIGSYNPDGSQVVAFLKRPRKGAPSLLCVTKDFEEYTELTSVKDTNIRDAAWSLDNMRIVFVTSNGLHTISPDGEDLQDFLVASNHDNVDIKSVDISPVGNNMIVIGKKASDAEFKLYYTNFDRELIPLEYQPTKDGDLPLPSPGRVSWGVGFLRY